MPDKSRTGEAPPSEQAMEAAFAPPVELAEAATTLFGDRLPLVEEYARRLATDGVERGLIGPREGERLWDRHLLNCAVLTELIPIGASVLDVGSGAGLPGIVLALARPDLTVVLVESLARRTAFLTELVSALALPHVTVVRGRAEECASRLDPADVVTARAVAPLDRLARWCLPLTVAGGRVLALKGVSAADEVTRHRAAVAAAGGGTPVVRRCGVGVLAEPAIVVEIVRERAGRPNLAGRAGPRSSGRASGRLAGGGRYRG